LSKKGFTLVELLLVIGVIAILSFVVVPRIGAIRDNVRLAGIDNNMRIIKAYTQSVLENFNSNQANIFEEEMASTFEGDNIANPFTRAEGVRAAEALGTNGLAVVYSTHDNTAAAVASLVADRSARNELRGSIRVAAYPNPDNSNSLEVVIFPYDRNGRPILSKRVVVTP